MARLYSGLDALGIGGAINNVNNSLVNQRERAVDRFSNGLEALFADRARKQKEAEMQQSAAQFAESSGLTPEQARYLAGVSPQLAAQEGIGRQHEQRQRGYADEDYSRTRKDKQLDMGFSALNNQLLQILARADETIPTKARAAQDKAIFKDYKDFLTAHPEYMATAIDSISQAFGNDDNTYFQETFDEDLAGLRKKGTRKVKSGDDEVDEEYEYVDPTEMKSLYDKLVENKMFDKLMSEPANERSWNSTLELLEGDKLSRESEFLQGTRKTQYDAKVDKLEHEKELRAKKAEKDYKEKLEQFKKFRLNNGVKPSFTTSELERLKKEHPEWAKTINANYK